MTRSGSGSVRWPSIFPIALVVVAVVLMRTEPDPEQRPRRIAGGIGGDPVDHRHPAGAARQRACRTGTQDTVGAADGRPAEPLGWLIGQPLFIGVTAIPAIILLVLLGGFGVLLISGIPLVEVPGRIRDAVGRLGERRIPTDENGEYVDGSGTTTAPAARSQLDPRGRPVHHPAAPAVPASSGGRRRSRPPTPMRRRSGRRSGRRRPARCPPGRRLRPAAAPAADGTAMPVSDRDRPGQRVIRPAVPDSDADATVTRADPAPAGPDGGNGYQLPPAAIC